MSQFTPPVSSTPAFYRPCWAEVDLAALSRNIQTLRARLSPPSQLLAVVKADGYGHGLLEAARASIAGGAVYLGVSSLEEGVALRRSGIREPILVLGSLFPFDNFPVIFEHGLTPTVASLETAEALDRLAVTRGERLPVHLKIDSGFGRIGVSIPRALEFIQQVAALRGLVLEGVYTHFASSDVDLEYTRQQATLFRNVMDQAGAAGIRPRFVHMANSAALLRLPETHGTLVRPGLSIYGVLPFANETLESPVTPILTWKTKVIYVKQWPEGASVSYARTWTAARQSRIATLAVGYADGYPRSLTNQGQILLRGRRVPVIGRVTMDMTMVDATDLPECRVGDEAVILGSQGDDRITAAEIAAWAQTNPYEILSRIAPRVPRVYHRD